MKCDAEILLVYMASPDGLTICAHFGGSGHFQQNELLIHKKEKNKRVVP